MNKKIIAVLCAVFALVLVAGGVFVACLAGGNGGTDGTAATTEQLPDATGGNQTEDTTEPVTGTEGTDGPVAEMGVIDREDFDDGTTPTQRPVEKDSTEPSNGTEPDEQLPPAENADPDDVTYEQYEAMSREQKEAFMQRFPSEDAFIDWLADAREKVPAVDSETLDGNEVDLSKVKP
jgi:hypothetical protein